MLTCYFLPMVSKTGQHALKALTELAKLPDGTFAAVEAIAKEINAPRNYLGKLLQILTRAGLVRSQKGIGGGFRLTQDARKTTLYEIIELTDHVSRWDNCFMGKGVCSSDAACSVHHKWKKTRDSYLKFLRGTTIADFL